MIKPVKCKHNPKVLCGVVKNVGHCPYVSEELCQRDTVTSLLGLINKGFGTITLKKFRYNLHKISIKVLDVNMCNECRVIWADPTNCPICKGE